MRIGVVKEIKVAERRVALTPAGARELTATGHEVLVESGAGVGSAIADADYEAAGARVVDSAARVWAESSLLLKVKEPIAEEYPLLYDGLTLFTYLHLAPNRPLTDALVSSGVTAIAYETVEDAHGGLPLLAPMSEIAGRLAAQAGAYFLQAPFGGPGVLIGGVPGVAAARVVVIGGGAVGTHAARIAVGMEAEVTILERSLGRLRALDEQFGRRARVLMSDVGTVEASLRDADVVIGAVLVPGARTPRLVTREMLGLMRPSSVIVDVAIDQGGCFETSRATTHARPVYDVDGILHYCVANMPGAVPVTSTRALTNATLPYVRALANRGPEAALAADPGFARGLNIRGGELVYGPVAEAYALETALAAS
jgi:alanine dehydrogenase